MPNDTARGFDAALIEAMRYAICREKFDCDNHPCDGDDSGCCKPGRCKKPLNYADEATAALTALCTTCPDVAALLAGEAVAVPREATHEMIKAGRNRPYREEDTHIDYTDRNTELTWEAMLAASPYYTNDQ